MPPMTGEMAKRFVFLDRDGVINKDSPDYVKSWSEFEFLRAMMKKAVRDVGGEIKDIFFCPHKPEDGCKCRKPEPGLIPEALKKYGIETASIHTCVCWNYLVK